MIKIKKEDEENFKELLEFFIEWYDENLYTSSVEDYKDLRYFCERMSENLSRKLVIK